MAPDLNKQEMETNEKPIFVCLFCYFLGEAYLDQKEGGRVKGEKRTDKRHRKEGGNQISPTSKPDLGEPLSTCLLI